MGVEHQINIPLNTMFPRKIPHQKPLSDNQHVYLNKAINKLITADIIETIHPEDVKCCSPLTLVQKANDNAGLSLNELHHRVNEECILRGRPPAHNTEPQEPLSTFIDHHKHAMSTTQAKSKPQTWCICQNYSALNRVTQVFSTSTGDICTKQRKLSGHQWIHKFDFTSRFYAVSIPTAT